MTLDAFLDAIRPELERQVDAQILHEPDREFRHVLLRHRERLVEQAVIANKVANLQHRLAQAEERLRPQLIHDAAKLPE